MHVPNLSLLLLSAISVIALPQTIKPQEPYTLESFCVPTQADFTAGMTAAIHANNIDTSTFIFYDGNLGDNDDTLGPFKTAHPDLHSIRNIMSDAWITQAGLVYSATFAPGEAAKTKAVFWGNVSKAYASLATQNVVMLLRREGGALVGPANSGDPFLQAEVAILKANGIAVTAYGVMGNVAEATGEPFDI